MISNWISCYIVIEVHTTSQPNGVWLDIAAGLGIVIAEAIVMEPSFLVEILAGKAQVINERRAIPIRIFVRQRRTEWVTFPVPHYLATRIRNGARSVEMIGINKEVCVILQYR